jgi:hypothetical protein
MKTCGGIELQYREIFTSHLHYRVCEVRNFRCILPDPVTPADTETHCFSEFDTGLPLQQGKIQKQGCTAPWVKTYVFVYNLVNAPGDFFQSGTLPPLFTPTLNPPLSSNVLQWQSAQSGFPEGKDLAKHGCPIPNQETENVTLGVKKKVCSRH